MNKEPAESADTGPNIGANIGADTGADVGLPKETTREAQKTFAMRRKFWRMHTSELELGCGLSALKWHR